MPATRLSMIDVFDIWSEVLPMLCRATARLENVPGMKLDSLTALAPVMPRQIVCAGANYRKHVIDILADHPGSGSDPAWSVEERRLRAEKIMNHRAAQGQPFAFVKAQSAVLGPYADLILRLNGETMQHESTANMIFPIARLIEYVSTHMQLLPGDLLCTGSPAGNGTHYRRFLRPGDLLEGSIEMLGAQRNRCCAEVLTEDATLHRPFVALGSP